MSERTASGRGHGSVDPTVLLITLALLLAVAVAAFNVGCPRRPRPPSLADYQAACASQHALQLDQDRCVARMVSAEVLP